MAEINLSAFWAMASVNCILVVKLCDYTFFFICTAAMSIFSIIQLTWCIGGHAFESHGTVLIRLSCHMRDTESSKVRH